VKLPAQSGALPGNVDMIVGSALTPLRESVTALPAYLPTAGRQGGASSRLAREAVLQQKRGLSVPLDIIPLQSRSILQVYIPTPPNIPRDPRKIRMKISAMIKKMALMINGKNTARTALAVEVPWPSLIPMINSTMV
jgi:hypothetical protein